MPPMLGSVSREEERRVRLHVVFALVSSLVALLLSVALAPAIALHAMTLAAGTANQTHCPTLAFTSLMRIDAIKQRSRERAKRQSDEDGFASSLSYPIAVLLSPYAFQPAALAFQDPEGFQEKTLSMDSMESRARMAQTVVRLRARTHSSVFEIVQLDPWDLQVHRVPKDVEVIAARQAAVVSTRLLQNVAPQALSVQRDSPVNEANMVRPARRERSSLPYLSSVESRERKERVGDQAPRVRLELTESMELMVRKAHLGKSAGKVPQGKTVPAEKEDVLGNQALHGHVSSVRRRAWPVDTLHHKLYITFILMYLAMNPIKDFNI
ncbi:hypothetical protein QR680_011285 [Steinernema hermaphroditum]|uniref:Uncharacterized protein n=1 Tax=Steinernema hermaphroditum TaxID=289476 RepID=A0AA39IT91_9BILA|nr:hypothetical protein QR680_011285 [Steinernema hermaphroditum]